MKIVNDNGEVSNEQKKLNLLTSLKDVEAQRDSLRATLYEKKYKVIYETEKHKDTTYNYAEIGMEKYFQDLLEYIKNDIRWVGWHFINVDAIYNEVLNAINEKSYELRAYALEFILESFKNTDFRGHNKIHDSIYILTPINHTYGLYHEDSQQLQDIDNMIQSIQSQLYMVEEELQKESNN